MIARGPRFKVGQWVWVRGYRDRGFFISKVIRYRGKSGYLKYRYVEIWTQWDEKTLMVRKPK